METWQQWTPAGGTPEDPRRHYGRSETLGVWLHEPGHPAWTAHIRYRRYLESGLWWVQCTDRPTGEWLFRREQDAELAVVELLALHEPNQRTE